MVNTILLLVVPAAWVVWPGVVVEVVDEVAVPALDLDPVPLVDWVVDPLLADGEVETPADEPEEAGAVVAVDPEEGAAVPPDGRNVPVKCQ